MYFDVGSISFLRDIKKLAEERVKNILWYSNVFIHLFCLASVL